MSHQQAASAARAPILIVDPDLDHRSFMDGALRRGGFRAASVSNGEQALEAADRERPLLAVLEVRLGDISGYEVCRALRERFGETVPIMFLSGDRAEPCDHVAGLLLGADEYLGKPLTADELLVRVRGLVKRNGNGSGKHDPTRRLLAFEEGLTMRELEVIELLADGIDGKAIAAKLVITPKTVAKHIEHILQKLGAHSRAEAVAEAYKRGLASGTRRGRP